MLFKIIVIIRGQAPIVSITFLIIFPEWEWQPYQRNIEKL